MLNNFGNLTIRTYTAGGGLPVEGVKVKIRGSQETNSHIYHELLTNEDGNTPKLTLPAPDKDYSLAPSSSTPPYSLYDVEVEKNGYYSKKIYGLSIFSGVNSLQLINMIPLSEGGVGQFPRGDLNTVIPTNPNL